MKHPRPSLREIVRPPQISDFIEKGVVTIGASPAQGDQEIDLRVPIPAELYEALLVKLSDQGKTLPESFREMLLDFLMKDA